MGVLYVLERMCVIWERIYCAASVCHIVREGMLCPPTFGNRRQMAPHCSPAASIASLISANAVGVTFQAEGKNELGVTFQAEGRNELGVTFNAKGRNELGVTFKAKGKNELGVVTE